MTVVMGRTLMSAWGVSFFAAMEREQIELLLRRGRVRYSEVFSTQMKRHGGERGR